MKELKVKINCSHCSGLGKIEDYPAHGATWKEVVNCYRCNGTGVSYLTESSLRESLTPEANELINLMIEMGNRIEKVIDKEEQYEKEAEKILELLIIAKALELYQKALDGKLVELDEKQEVPIRIYINESNKDEELELSGHTQMDMIKYGWRKVKELNIK